jgi:YegS/Rv2252/BmrU family lipid kinase
MRKATLLYNPLSGRHPERRIKDIESAATVLRAAGIDVTVEATRDGSTIKEQVREAIVRGCDVVFACGGDGTIHDVLQGLVGTNTTLGIIPLGTANTLAHDLGLPLSPVAAAKAALTSQPKRIAVGKVEYKDLAGNPAARYFTVTVGIGFDARLFYELNSKLKQKLGMSAYYATAWRIWFCQQIDYFVATCDHLPERYLLTQLLAVRIRNFGGVLRELAPGASLDRNDLRLVLCSTKSRLSYLSYIVRGLMKANWSVPGVKLMSGIEVNCDYPQPSEAKKTDVYVEADGELIGTLPASICTIPDALTLLFPNG